MTSTHGHSLRPRAALLVLALACTQPPPADTAQPVVDPLEQIDTDGDGVLEVDDLADGQSAVWFTLEEPGAEPVDLALLTDASTLGSVDDSAWYIQAAFAPSTDLVIRFALGGLVEDHAGVVEHIHLADSSSDLFARADTLDATVEIVFVGGGRASGQLDSEVVLLGEDIDSGESTGAVATVHAAVFRTVAYE